MIENENDIRFLYIVYPKRPIKNLNENITLLRVSKSLQLNKDEVLKCLECGSVYRWFSNEGITEKITINDIDRVHRANYISKEDWKHIQNISGEVANLTVNGIENPKKEVKTEKNVETKVEEVKEEVSIVDPEPEVETKEEGYIANEVLNKVVEDTVDDEVEETNDSIVETENNDEIIEDTDVEDEEIEAVEEESKDEDTESTEEGPKNVVVNYHNNKKKKHH